MAFHLVFLVLALALTSAAFPFPTATNLPAHGDSLDLEWAAAKVSIAGDSLALGMNERIGESLSDVWDLPAGLLFCNYSSDTTINHSYVATLMNGLYAGRANSALLRAKTGDIWKVTHKIGVLRGTQICRFHPSSVGDSSHCFPSP